MSTTHAEKRVLPYSAKQMYDLVADIERYPEFLPWCLKTDIISSYGQVTKAKVDIGYKVFRESYISKVTFTPPHQIDVVNESGPFKHLNNHWKFREISPTSCEVDFYIDFAFESILLQSTMGFFFNEAVKVMISAFEKRANNLYK